MADDLASLQDALQVIDEWDVDIVALFGLDDTAVPPKKRRRKPCAKVERLELRQELEQLNARMALETQVPSTQTHDGFLCHEWKAIAMRQREQRVAATVENGKLRSLLDSHLKVARRASTLVHKASLIGEAVGSDPIPSIDSYRGPHMDISAQIERLDTLALEAETVFSSEKFVGNDFRDIEFHLVKNNRLMIDLRLSWVLPFEMTSVIDALWYHTTCMPRIELTTTFKDIYEAKGILVSQFVSDTKKLGTIRADRFQAVAGSTHGQIATRLEPPTNDGAVLLVSAINAHNLREGGEYRSRVKGDGFILVRPLNVGEPSICRVSWYRRIVGSAPDDSDGTATEYSKWVNSFMSCAMRDKWWRSIDSTLQSIENMLLTPSST